jgi:GH35 family endo-1,4-beta-xylanase
LLKFRLVHPAPDRYAFDAQDRFVQFGLDRKMQVVGHTLVWHQQTPAWVFQGADGTPADRETLLARMRDHIHTSDYNLEKPATRAGVIRLVKELQARAASASMASATRHTGGSRRRRSARSRKPWSICTAPV